MLSSQMLWATLAHVTNDWLAVPLAVWLLVAVIHYDESPSVRRAALASGVLSIGLLTKAYFIAFVPLLASVCVLRRKWRDLGIVLAMIAALAGPWYRRNMERYGTISGMQELREGTDPAAAFHAIRIEKLPATIDAYARSALWTANNSFRSFSINTLRAVMLAWLAALFLWVVTKRRRAEWIVLLYAGVFVLALGYDTAISYVASRETDLSVSASSLNVRPCFAQNSWWLPVESTLTPTITARFCSYLARSRWKLCASMVQPGVPSLG